MKKQLTHIEVEIKMLKGNKTTEKGSRKSVCASVYDFVSRFSIAETNLENYWITDSVKKTQKLRGVAS